MEDVLDQGAIELYRIAWLIQAWLFELHTQAQLHPVLKASPRVLRDVPGHGPICTPTNTAQYLGQSPERVPSSLESEVTHALCGLSHIHKLHPTDVSVRGVSTRGSEVGVAQWFQSCLLL